MLTQSCALSGFRYVEIDFGGHPHAPPTLETITGIVLRSNVAEAATISLGSDPSHLAQRVSSNSLWTEAAALMSIPAGAAGRGERNGWTGDAAMGSESELFVRPQDRHCVPSVTVCWPQDAATDFVVGSVCPQDFDTGAFFSRYVEQLLDSQCADGELGNGVPPAGSNTSLHACGNLDAVERVKDPNW